MKVSVLAQILSSLRRNKCKRNLLDTTLELSFFFRYKNITSFDNYLSLAKVRDCPTGLAETFAVVFVLNYWLREFLLFEARRGGGRSSIVKVPVDVPPATVYCFKLSCLGKGILFANFSQFSLGKGMLFVNVGRFQSWQEHTFWKFRSTKCQISVIPVKKPKFFFKFWSRECKYSFTYSVFFFQCVRAFFTIE